MLPPAWCGTEKAAVNNCQTVWSISYLAIVYMPRAHAHGTTYLY